jgi:flagellar biosynthetic protein FlhB
MAHDDKTEAATPQRRKDARNKGQVARSPEVTSVMVLFCGIYVLKGIAPMAVQQLASAMTQFLGNLSSFSATQTGVQDLFLQVTLTFFRIAGPLLGAVALVGLISNLAQVGLFFSGKLLAPDLTRIDPIKGIGRMFSGRALVELAKSLAKIVVVGYVIWLFLKGEQSTVVSLGLVDRSEAARITGDLIWRLCVRACSVLLLIAGGDYIYQKVQFEKSIKMTKQEVKEEFKQAEGDPHVKAQFKQKHRQLAMQRMMQDVPKADVIITNPTHYAVALKYDSETMAAPVVVAKGKDLIAQRIKQIAKENGVPTVENKPVARALFAATEIGHPVPVDLYQAVAEILAFVYRLRYGGGYRAA